jgi:hypothetical protein
MSLSKKAIDEFKEIYKKEYGKELNDEEAFDSATNLLNFFEALYKSAEAEYFRKCRLKEEPEGFHLTDDVYDCSICGTQISGETSWYDKWGMKCLLCQKAVKEGIVPSFVCKDSDSWYAIWQLEDKFGIKHQTAKKMVRLGKLKARIVPYEDGSPYKYVFLKKENPHLIDPGRKSPAEKSYFRNQEKKNTAWVRREKEKFKKELKQRNRRRKERY